ncbi:MAG: hypothetical protein ABL966_15085 [Acidimicrobiales bacterium]
MDVGLLRLELDTLWVTDADGRLRRCRTDAGEPPPLLVVGAGDSIDGCWAASAALPAAVVDRLQELLAHEPVQAPAVGWAPRAADALVAAARSVGPLAAPHGGPSYLVPAGLVPDPSVELHTSADADAAATLALLPSADRSLAAPWVIAIVDGQAAAVCETARDAPASVEAGVWTYEPFRRRGLAVAVTAAWSALVTDRTAFYSTSWDNHASQAVAHRLGLPTVGHWWQLSAAR